MPQDQQNQADHDEPGSRVGVKPATSAQLESAREKPEQQDRKDAAVVDPGAIPAAAAQKPGRSPSARRREQRARAKERAATKDSADTSPQVAGVTAATVRQQKSHTDDKIPSKAGSLSKAANQGSTSLNKTIKTPVGDDAGAILADTVSAGNVLAETAPTGTLSADQKTATKPAAPKRKRPVSKRGKQRQAEEKKSTFESASADSPGDETPPVSGTHCKLLINTDEPEECRLALVENGKVEGFYIESKSRAQYKGNIYKGRITSVEANLQAAFVDIGLPKNGFLSFSEIHPEYYTKKVDPDTHWKDLKIQEVIKKSQEVLVEVVKEAAGNKGPSLTTYISLPGRCLVLMPGSDSAGISRKIDDEVKRRKLREMAEALNIPEGIGYIVRTASQEITKTALNQDLRYLLNLWEEIRKTGQEVAAPALVYQEQNIISRFLRDHYTTDIKEILVDAEDAAEQVRDFLQLLPAIQRRKTTVKLHQGSQPIFHQYHVEKQIEQMFQPTIPLASGGSIVINPTEALVAIDVNSGRTAAKDRDFEASIFIANMEAAEELARQLRMRDLGGLIVVDFIDMRSAAHTREVEKRVRECMKKDKAKVDFSRISKFGLMQISRQKMAAPIQTTSYKTCPNCEGRGMIPSVENLALSHLRQLQTGLSRRRSKKVNLSLPMDVGQYILNKKREDLLELEKEYQADIIIEVDPTMPPAGIKIDFRLS